MHIAQQSRAGVAAFEKIVAKNAIFREAPANCLLEGIDVVDSLADERSFSEHVLVDIRDRARIGVDARLAPIQARIARAVGRREADRHARLQDAVARADAPFRGIVAGAIQRVRHGADEFARRIARQLRIGVQRYHVFNGREDRAIPDDERKAVPGATAQQRIQVGELAALALVTHPQPVLGVPAPRAMEEEEEVIPDAAPVSAVLLVQLADPLARQFQQRCVLGERFLASVAEIGQQAEVQAFIAIRQKPDFQRLDQLLHSGRAGKHRRDDDQGACVGRDAFAEIHSRQGVRRHEQRCQPVHQRYAQLTGSQQRDDADRHQQPVRRPGGKRLRQQACRDDRRDQSDAAQVREQWEAACRRAQGLGAGTADLRCALELRQTLVDQVVADVPGTIASAAASIARHCTHARQVDRLAGNLDLG